VSSLSLFVGGIMQGSKQEMAVHDQTYRDRIAAIVRRHHPDVQIVDPAKLHPDSTAYSRQQAITTFCDSLQRAATADALIAYLPEASMGTAIEIWCAHEAGKPVFVISPMLNNWMLWVTATRIFPDIDAFSTYVASGHLKRYLQQESRTL
jgi:hypothetical protein